MSIPVQDATNVFSDALVAVYNERPRPSVFLQSFFRSKFVPAKNIRITVRRGSEYIAVDVHRYSDGNLNIVSFTDEKKFEPPVYDDYIVINSHALYDNMIGLIASMSMGTLDANAMSVLSANLQTITAQMADDLVKIRDKQIRSVELQCAQIFNTGIVTLVSAEDIDFKRQAASHVDLGAANYWTDAGTDPYADLEAGCQFLRKEGLTSATVFDGVFGHEALSALKNNARFIERQDNRTIESGAVGGAQRNAIGAGSHGMIPVGSYWVRIWSYDQYYKDPADNLQKSYVDPKKVVLIPDGAEFDLSWCLVDQNIENGTIPQTSEFLISEWKERKATEMHVECAPLAVPTAVDQIYDLQVVA